MKIFGTTPRLYLRELEHDDVEDLYEMDADPAVHRYIENKPVQSRDEISRVIGMLKEQYRTFGIARWAVIDKENNECIGWAGLKYFNEPINNHSNIYELGYRFKQKHWGKGFATESAGAVLKYGFNILGLEKIYAITHPDNDNSKRVLTKLGFEYKERFDYDGDPTDWFVLQKQNCTSCSPE